MCKGTATTTSPGCVDSNDEVCDSQNYVIFDPDNEPTYQCVPICKDNFQSPETIVDTGCAFDADLTTPAIEIQYCKKEGTDKYFYNNKCNTANLEDCGTDQKLLSEGEECYFDSTYCGEGYYFVPENGAEESIKQCVKKCVENHLNPTNV